MTRTQRTNAGTGYQGFAADPAAGKAKRAVRCGWCGRSLSMHTLEDRVAEMAIQVRQLVAPIHMAQPCWLKAQHGRKCAGHILTHPALLDQLRDACTPSGQTLKETVRQRHKESQPPVSTGALNALAEVYVGISRMHQHLQLPSPDRSLDWQKAAVSMIAAAAEERAPAIAAWIAADVESWWHDAAVGSGWRPDDLRRLR